MKHILLPLLATVLLGPGCAKPPPPPLWIDAYHEFQSEAGHFFPDETANQYLSVAKTRYNLAQQFDEDKKWDEAALSYQLAAATAQVGLESAKADWDQRKAKECELFVLKAKQEWKDTLSELERTEKATGQTAEISRSTEMGYLGGLDYKPIDRPYLTLEDARQVIAENEQALRLAESLGVSVSDLSGPIEHFSARAMAEVEADARAPYELMTARSAQALQYRVAAAQAAERCRRSVDALAHYHDLEKETVWALVQLERGMKESAREQLEEERLVMESQQNKLYTALKQFEGQFAQLTQSARGTIISMGDILFETGKADLKQQALFNLVKVATILQQFPEMHIYVEGHTDDVGAEEFNKTLSEERAQTVFNFLNQQGVPLNRMDWFGYGMSKPIAPNTTPKNRGRNRRVDIVIGGSND